MGMSRILMLGLMTTGLILAVNQSAWAHPPEEHTAAVAADPSTPVTEQPASDEQVHEEAPLHLHDLVTGTEHQDELMPHQGGDAAAEPTLHEHGASAMEPPHDESSPHEHGAPTSATQHDESTPHEHGAEAGSDHHEEGGHSHWGDNGANTPLEKAIERLGVYHPLLVHFPIALILAAALAQALNLAGVRASNAETVRFLVWTGAFGGLAAGFFGWAHAGPMASDEAGIMLAHRWIGSSLTLGLFAVAGAVEWNRKSPSGQSAIVMNLALFTAAAAVAVNGFLGGSLAHGGVNHLMEM